MNLPTIAFYSVANSLLPINSKDLPLSNIDPIQLCSGSTTDITLNTPFTLSVLPAQLGKAEDLLVIIKYSF